MLEKIRDLVYKSDLEELIWDVNNFLFDKNNYYGFPYCRTLNISDVEFDEEYDSNNGPLKNAIKFLCPGSSDYHPIIYYEKKEDLEYIDQLPIYWIIHDDGEPDKLLKNVGNLKQFLTEMFQEVLDNTDLKPNQSLFDRIRTFLKSLDIYSDQLLYSYPITLNHVLVNKI